METTLLSSAQLAEITRREVAAYLAESPTSTLYALLDDQQKQYAILAVPRLPRRAPARVIVMAHIVDDKIVIEENITDKPLYEALMVNASVLREQIVLAYAGE